MKLKDILTVKMETFLDSLYVNYVDEDKDPDLVFDRNLKRYVLFDGHTCTLREYIGYIKEHGYEKSRITACIYLDKEDKEDGLGCSVLFVRHYKLVDMTIAVSSTLDEFFIAPIMQYFRKEGFEPGRCGVVEECVYEKEKKAL